MLGDLGGARKVTLQWLLPRRSLLLSPAWPKTSRAEADHTDFFMGYSGGIQRVFGGILMICKVFGDLGTFSDIAVTTLGATSDPPK